MPNGFFQKGYDPRRYDGSRAKLGMTPMVAGNTVALKHGLGGSVAHPLEQLPEEYRVILVADTDLVRLEGELEAVIALALAVHTALTLVESVETLEAQGKFTQILTKMGETLLRMQSRTVPPTRAGDLTMLSELEETQRWRQVGALKEQYARTLSGDLSKLKCAYTYFQTKDTLIDEKQGRVYPWISVGLTTLLSGCRTTMERWSALLLWEEAQRGKQNQVMEAYAKATSRRHG